LQVPKQGYDHVYGQELIDTVDRIDLGDEDNRHDNGKKSFFRSPGGSAKGEHGDNGAASGLKNPHDFGSTKTPADASVGSLKDKWRLLPHFLKIRSLMKGHVDSFDHLVNVELNQIFQSPSAKLFGPITILTFS
jgi:hypothetical protein